MNRAQPLLKPENVEFKTENDDTPPPSLCQAHSASPTAQSVLEAVRQVKASQRNLQAELHKIITLKRKHQQDHDDTDANNATSKRVKPKYEYEPDTDTDSNSDTDNNGEKSVSPELMDDDE